MCYIFPLSNKAISEVLLWENNDYIGALFELIKLGFMMEFNEEAVGFKETFFFL
jgi:hypothetical protein